jgi:hypothetical protein
MICWPVSPRVGNVKNNDSRLIEPIAAAQTLGPPRKIYQPGRSLRKAVRNLQDDRPSPMLVPRKPRPLPRLGFSIWHRCSAAGSLSDMKTRVMPSSQVGDRKARADGERGELIDRIAPRAPIRQLLLVELLGHTRLPFARYRPDHRARVELATIDAHRAAEAAADIERRLDDGVARQARRDRLEIGDLRGGRLRVIPVLLVRSNGCARSSILCRPTVRPA